MRLRRRNIMPRKTKEPKITENESKLEKAVKKITSSKKSATHTEKEKKATTKKNTSTIKNKIPKTKEKIVTQAEKKKTVTRKATTKKTSMKKVSSKKTVSSPRKKVEVLEYYDLPYRYNQTIVRILAQTPTNLFIYWDISDKDRKNFQKQYGENLFETTKPVLIIHNDTLGYSFEVEINDFANSWYLHVADSKCDYRIELGRRPIIKNEKINTDYIYITMSNKIESPNDRILFDKNQKMVYFKNVKTGQKTQKAITSISFIRNMGKIYNIYDIYQTLYPDEKIEETYNLSNPSSSNPSSGRF